MKQMESIDIELDQILIKIQIIFDDGRVYIVQDIWWEENDNDNVPRQLEIYQANGTTWDKRYGSDWVSDDDGKALIERITTSLHGFLLEQLL